MPTPRQFSAANPAPVRPPAMPLRGPHPPAPAQPAHQSPAARVGAVAADLTMSKVMAGGMAAATSSVLGSYFGALGTVGGAAVGAVATTVATSLYQRSIERTKDSVRNRVRRAAGLPDTPTYADAARAAKLAKQRTVRLDPTLAAPAPARPRRTWKVLIGAPLMIFALALAAVTGIELAKGSMLFDNEGRTSIQRVLSPRPAAVTPAPAPVAPPSENTPSSESEHDSGDSRDDSGSRDERDDSRDDRGGLLDPKRDGEDPTDRLRPTDSNPAPPLLPNLLGH